MMCTKKKILIVVLGIEAIVIVAVLAFLLYINSDTVKVNRQLELAQRYLLEEDYEQAIAAFEVVIEIDPKNAEAYLGLAEAYEATDDIENVVKILERGFKRTNSDEIRELLKEHKEEIEKRELAAQRAAEAAARAASETALILLESSDDTRTETEDMTVDEACLQAYKDFLLNTDIDQWHDFPIWGYYLFDLNFDGIPELGVHHCSGGSMGGYFTFYRFDGKNIVPAVLNENDDPIQISDQTKILADYEHQIIYFYKEMYLLVGNDNGTYGYVRELIDKNGVLYSLDMLWLEVNYDWGLDKLNEIVFSYNYIDENDYLLGSAASEYLITKAYSGGEWQNILPEEYLAKKRKLIPDENSFINIRNTDVCIFLYESLFELAEKTWEQGDYHNRQMTEEEIDILFAKWTRST